MTSWARRANPVFSDEYQVVREVLSHARRSAGLSQRSLASRLGKASSHVARIEAGQRRVDTLEFYQIARALGVDPVPLFELMSSRLDALGDRGSGFDACIAHPITSAVAAADPRELDTASPGSSLA